jgi:cytochrome c oxidase subunit 2
MADEAYIRDSILQPHRDVAAGYEPIMPSFAGLLSDGEIQSLVAYVRSLSTPPQTATTRPPSTNRSLVPGAPDDRSPAMTPGTTLERPTAGGPARNLP